MLNELSLPTPEDPLSEDELGNALGGFVDMLRAARNLRGNLALVSLVGLAGLPVAEDGRTLGAILGARGGRMREQWRFLQLIRNYAPFATAPGLVLGDQAEEYRHAGALALGLGLAAANGQLAVSFKPTSWDRPEIECERAWLEEDETGDIAERAEPVLAKHAATQAHIAQHERFVRELALPRPFGGADLWADRAALYPHVAFLPHVKSQLCSMSAGSAAFHQVADRLAELEAATSAWVPGDAPAPTWKSHVTPEGEQRKRLCWFVDLDGEERCFDLHARFTPGAGRIHFRLAPRQAIPRIVVAYIGGKL